MAGTLNNGLVFESRTIKAAFIDPAGARTSHDIQIRKNPITGRTSRITFARINEKEAGTQALPDPPPGIHDTRQCPFCASQIETKTPKLMPVFDATGRMKKGKSVLFPNLFPYGAYSAVSIFNDDHFVEIGRADPEDYADCFINCANYLKKISVNDTHSVYMAITQNHLPSAGGSLVHPHLQVQADAVASNHHRFLNNRAHSYFEANGSFLFNDYAAAEKKKKDRYIGSTGRWEWMAAFAPEGFYEIWAILPCATSILALDDSEWTDLSQGIVNTQKFYRHLFRNGYNLGLLSVEEENSAMDLCLSIKVRSNYAPWTRSDFTGFEVMLGDMATFSSPEHTAALARRFWS